MKEKEFKAVFDGEKYVMPQESKYRIKNKISEKATTKIGRPFFRRSVSAILSVVLASVLVITAAAVGGVVLFKSIYGDHLEPIMPYGERINLKAADENYELTLHEAVADEYTTAYIFSVKRLTVGVSEPENRDESKMIFKGLWRLNAQNGFYSLSPNQEPLNSYNAHDTTQIQMFTGGLYGKQLKFLRTDAAFDAENTAQYLVRSIDDLKTEDTDYCAFYVINGEDQTLSIAIGEAGGPEIELPKIARKTPSVTRSVQEYYRQYLKQNHPTLLFSGTQFADIVTVTPLGVYVSNTGDLRGISADWASGAITYVNKAFYRTAELVFHDGTKKTLNEMSQDETGICVTDMGVYLFDEVMDASLVKSFMIYETVEFPMDTALPVVDRATGDEIVPEYETIDLLFEMSSEITRYLDGMYPEERKRGEIYCISPIYVSENACKIIAYDCEIIMSAYEPRQGETITAAADRLVEEFCAKYSWTITDIARRGGICALGNVRYADITVNISGGRTHRTHFFFIETGGKSVVMQLNETTDAWPYYSLDALLRLVTFN